jgi:hypothetical protein
MRKGNINMSVSKLSATRARTMNVPRHVVLNQLQEGSLFTKFNSDGSMNECFFYISPKLNVLCYNTSNKILKDLANECKI